jgi:hypothetical protein
MPGTMLEELQARARELWKDKGLLGERVDVAARVLTADEALGDPEGDDFPLQKGRERMMEAAVLGARGHAFSDRFGDFAGTLAQIADMDLANNYRRAVFVAAFNASMRALGLCDRTVHCRDAGPGECAGELRAHLRQRYGDARVTQVGFQPKFVAALAADRPLRVLDLDPDNIGHTLHGALIEGPEHRDDAIAWADVLLVTGSALVNGSMDAFAAGKPLVVFGVSGAGAAALMGWERFCVRST